VEVSWLVGVSLDCLLDWVAFLPRWVAAMGMIENSG
jgi:hypothetical protein